MHHSEARGHRWRLRRRGRQRTGWTSHSQTGNDPLVRGHARRRGHRRRVRRGPWAGRGPGAGSRGKRARPRKQTSRTRDARPYHRQVSLPQRTVLAVELADQMNTAATTSAPDWARGGPKRADLLVNRPAPGFRASLTSLALSGHPTRAQHLAFLDIDLAAGRSSELAIAADAADLQITGAMQPWVGLGHETCYPLMVVPQRGPARLEMARCAPKNPAVPWTPLWQSGAADDMQAQKRALSPPSTVKV